jgi:hypothetical protein
LPFIAQTLKGGDSRHRYGRRFLERQIGRFQCHFVFRSTCVFGKTAPNHPEYLITRLKLLNVFANRFNPTRYVSTESRVFGFEQPPAHQADQEDVGGQEMPVIRIYRRRMNLDQDFIILGRRFFYILELKNIR